MKRNIRFFFLAIFLVFSTLNLNSCSNRQEVVSCFPNVAINVVLYLNLPAYYNLQTVGGWIYIDEQSCGTRGLIAVRTINGFKIYDRNAPHLCPEANTTLKVVNDIKIVCEKDNSEWILLTGQPTSGATVPPKTYLYNYDQNNNILTIYD